MPSLFSVTLANPPFSRARAPFPAPQVVPVLLQLTRGADDLGRRVDMVRALTDLVVLMRQHVRKFLPDLLALVADFWGTAPAMLPHVLQLLAELSREWVGWGAGRPKRRGDVEVHSHWGEKCWSQLSCHPFCGQSMFSS